MTLWPIATRVYAVAVRAFPRDHQSNYAGEMIDTFERQLAARRRDRGMWPALAFVIAACLNVVSEGIGERRRYRRSGRTPARAHAFSSFGRDLIHATRSLTKARAFTVVCVTSLGIGMATVLAILILMRGITAPQPGVKAAGLMEILITPHDALKAEAGDALMDVWSYPDFTDVRGADTGMSIAGWSVAEGIIRLRDEGGSARIPTMYVSGNYFETVGVTLARGPGFDAAADDVSTAQPVAVVSYKLWQNRLGARPDIVGSTLTVNRVEHVVVGVAPELFRGHVSPEEERPIQVWLPLEQHPRLRAAAGHSVRFERDVEWVRILGRLQPGTSLVQANAAVANIMSGLAERYPATNRLKAGTVEPYTAMGARFHSEAMAAQAMMVGISGVVLLVVCLNVSGMVVVRSATRERELAVRLAIGASRGRLVQYLLSESLVLALLGGGLASAVLFLGPAAVGWWFGISNAELDALQPDASMVSLCVVLCFVTSLVFGLLPAIRFSRPAVISALKDESGGGRRRVGRVQRLTAAIQAGVAVPLLVIGGVRLDQVRTTATADLGFDPKGLYAAPLDLASAGEPEDRTPLPVQTVLNNLQQASGVVSVTAADGLPLDFQRRLTRVSREGEAARPLAHVTRVADSYFDTMGVRLLRGRGIAAGDGAGAEMVAVISEPLAAQLYPGGNPVGGRVTFALEDSAPQVFTVVGVTEDMVTSQMGEPRPQLFVPLAQHPAPRVTLIARGTTAETSMTSAFQSALRDLDPDFNRASLTTGDQLVRKSIRDLITHSVLAGIAATVALTLAALGVYGVVGFMVATRTREIGVRIALGASRQRVLSTVLVDAMKVVVPGVGGGLLIAMGWVRSADPSWYPLGGIEPLAYAVASVVAILVAVLAGLPSARRAAAVEPLVAMRSE